MVAIFEAGNLWKTSKIAKFLLPRELAILAGNLRQEKKDEV